jgi:beta-fructofuranosidase
MTIVDGAMGHPASAGSRSGDGRPQFHFTAHTGWINDPHGITHRDGRYEVFFQHVPGSTTWGPNCHWGHASGADLFSLQELPVALAPGEGDDGIWTGSLVTDDSGRGRIFYTSTVAPELGMGRVRVAFQDDDDWIGWRKGGVVAEAPAELDVAVFRDPFILRDGPVWRMFVGASLADGSGAALSYVSEDLDAWRYVGIAAERPSAERDPIWMGALWECPQFIDLEGRHAMVTSVWEADVLHYAAYGVGDFEDGRFSADTWGRLTYGPSYYAPTFFRDADGRPCLMFWMRGVADVAAGWASALSVPHLLTREADRLVATPHPDLERYRGAAAAPGAPLGTAADVAWSPAGKTAKLEIAVGGGHRLAISVRQSRLTVRTEEGVWSMPFDGGPVRVILDGPVVEISATSGLLGVVVTSPEADYSVLTMDGEGTAWPLRR